jgi:hypothetical protein
MPLLYGEGEKAFQRLQQQIIGQTDDQSIFAWESYQTEESDLNTAEIGALALSPSDFDGCSDIVQCEAWKPRHTTSFELTKKGLRIEMPLVARSIYHSDGRSPVKQQILGLLNCRRSDDFLHLIAIPLGRPSVLFSDDQITSDGELLLVNRYRNEPTELCAEVLLSRSSLHTIHIRMVHNFTDRYGPHEDWIPAPHFAATGTKMRYHAVLIQPPADMVCQFLHIDTSLEVLYQGENIIVHEKGGLIPACRFYMTSTAYIHYLDTGKRKVSAKRRDFVTRMEFSAPPIHAAHILQRLRCFVRRRPWCLERTIHFRVARGLEMEHPNLKSPEYLSHLSWGEEIVVGGHKITVDTKKQTVMGSKMFVAVFTSTPVRASSQRTWRSIVVWFLLCFLCIVEAIDLRFKHSTVPVPQVKHKSAASTLPFVLSSFGIALAGVSLSLEPYSYAIMRLLFTTVGIYFLARFLLYLRQHGSFPVELSLLIMVGAFAELLLQAESWVQTECPGILEFRCADSLTKLRNNIG